MESLPVPKDSCVSWDNSSTTWEVTWPALRQHGVAEPGRRVYCKRTWDGEKEYGDRENSLVDSGLNHLFVGTLSTADTVNLI